jgi:LDH2 family malate/lactate/ureidoglycolate dehydrogenase
MTLSGQAVRATEKELREFAFRVLVAAGAADDAATACAEVLVDADLRGTSTHGIARLNQYAQALTSGRVSGQARPEVVAEHGGVIAVDAHNSLGPLGLRFATDVAIKAARRHGVATVTVRGSNHAGSMAWYTDRIVAAGMFALVLTGSTKAMVAPTHGASPFLGTNAVAYAAPAGESALSFDAAMSTASRSQLEAHQRAGMPLPEGWAVAPDGSPALDAGEVIEGIDSLSGHSLLPFGGTDAGHKGFGLGLLVELLCGPVAGGRWGPREHDRGPAGVGHFLLCLDLGAFGVPAEEIEKRTASLCAQLRAVPPASALTPVRVPGDQRRQRGAIHTSDGIPVPANVLAKLNEVAERTGVAALVAFAGEGVDR